ncbi:glycosyltransferase family 2 protein [Kaistella antarctica]|uniref:Chondroitin polymerase n=1 Tax=Kaistella antarctica TaxID=266748 RepID=A0A3S5EUU6_9FLAO|nr:glycosyltransferase [Kaistella antarctica]KEY17777.1 hypothetical protein HY04_04350 [Kaistella antarctica]SEV79868.1 Glycosyltransferase involved in cell wall bisynthesis [Kaistella antarctica]VEH99956.1 Chondroitin polymerase [Kaistella antarctica]
MVKPLVSIVVVSYNQAKYITQVLDSLKNQTYLNWELVVADDASQDDSINQFNHWLQNYNISAKKNYHTTNTGLASVLNECIALCEGEYIKLIAADDFLHPESIEKCVNCLEEKGFDYGLVFTDTFCIDEISNLQPDIADYNKWGNLPADEFKKELLQGNKIAALTVLMRTQVLKETGEYNAEYLVEDYYRWLKINENHSFAYVPEKLSYYRLHANNISKTKAERIFLETLMLQMMFDKTGIVKNRINSFVQKQYLLKQKIPNDLLELYRSYPYNIKRLVFAIRYGIPPMIYRATSKYI